MLRANTSIDVPFDFSRFIDAVSVQVPVAPSARNDHRYFLANGGSFSLENGASPDYRHALLEAATPECTSPMQLLESHHALQELASTGVRQSSLDNTTVLAQGNHDGNGHTYGQHESYDVQIANGFALFGWRIGLLLLLPCVFAYRFAAALWILCVVFLSRLERLSRKLVSLVRRKEKPSSTEDYQALTRDPSYIPAHWLLLCARGLRILHRPLAFLLWCNIQFFALRQYRRSVTSFFASRCIIDGCGFVDPLGRFSVSSRGLQINAVIGFGGYGRTRPIFRCDGWLKQLCMGSPFSVSSLFGLFRQRQRVEIATGDSGLCHHSQLVRIGATALVFDLVDRNPKAKLPRLRNPVDALRRFSKDWMLLAKEPDRSDHLWRASEIQNAYASQIRTMLEQEKKVPLEAWNILNHWQSTLNQLDLSDERSEPSKELVGRVDWITKLWLLDQLEKNASFEARRKLDLRYHELSEDGYGFKVLSVVNVPELVRRPRIDRAKCNPPNAYAPQQRSYYIREFGGFDSNLRMDWNEIRMPLANGKWKSIWIKERLEG